MMKVISTKMMMKVVATQQKSVCSFQFPIIVIRKYSTSKSSLVQLSEDIEHVYNDLIRNTNYSLSQSEFDVLKKKILLGKYILSPLRFKGVKKKNLRQFLLSIIDDCPDGMYFPDNSNPDLFIVIMPVKEDNLVLMGLSRLLYRLSKGSLPKENYRLANEEEDFYSSIQKMGTVDRLYHIDISHTYLTAFQVLNTVKLYVNELTVCYTLIKSFLNLPYTNSKGSLIYNNRLPLAGEITSVLKNLFYINIVDMELKRVLDGIAYSRYMSTIIIATKAGDEDIFNEDIAYSYMDYLGMDARIKSIGPGDDPIQCGNKMVVLNNDGKVFVY